MKRLLTIVWMILLAGCTPSTPPTPPPTALPTTALPTAPPTAPNVPIVAPTTAPVAATIAPVSRAATTTPNTAAPTIAPVARAVTPATSATPNRVYLPEVPQSRPFPGTPTTVRSAAVQPTPAAPPPTAPASAPTTVALGPDCAGLVTARDGDFWFNGQRWTFIGTNISYLSSLPLPQVDETFKFLNTHGVTVVRTWISPGDYMPHWDEILNLGQQYNIRFVIAFDDFWSKTKDVSWYGARYKDEYLPHVDMLVKRYRNRPEVFMWQLMNEPTCSTQGMTEECLNRMRSWARETTTLVRTLDTCRPMSVGLTGMGGTLEREELHYRLMARIKGIDTLTIHRNAFEDFEEKQTRELEVAEDEELPVVWGEIYERAYDKGCQPLSNDATSKRASLIRRDLQKSFEEGVDGYLLWQFAYGTLMENGKLRNICGEFDYERDDPVWNVFKNFKLPTQS